MVRDWFRWRQSAIRRKDGAFSKLFDEIKAKSTTQPRKRQMSHFLMTHPSYSARVKEDSKETGTGNRLQFRAQAATRLFEGMDEDERAKVVAERDTEHSQAMDEPDTEDLSRVVYEEGVNALERDRYVMLLALERMKY